MNILHVLEDYSIHSGGLRTVVKDLNEKLNDFNDINSFVISSNKELDDDIYTIQSSVGKPWLYSKNWKHLLEDLIHEKKINLIHVHGVWMFPQYLAAKLAVKKNIPFILTPHGMYEPWLWTKGTLKKNIFFQLFFKNLFSKSYRIHAITNDEKQNLIRLFPSSKFVEIPNLIKCSELSLNSFCLNKDEKYILYLGRLHEKKGIEILIKSFSKISDKNIKLKIAGGLNSYSEKLEEIIGELNLKNRVSLLGLVRGDKKYNLYKNAHVFVAPSYSEVIGMVNLEAALQNTPVITTYQTGLKKEWNENGGVLINPNEKELSMALEKAIKWSLEERKNNGLKLFKFVKENYSWESGISNWVTLYKNAARKSNRF